MMLPRGGGCMHPRLFEVLVAVIFALAVFHTFLIKSFQGLANKYPTGSVSSNLLHLLGEVELVVIGDPQKWWLEPLIKNLRAFPLFIGTTFLTAITDNAAITFLGSRLTGISESFKYSLVAGAVAGGGLTVIANAPNPAAFSILQEDFGPQGISPARLFRSALLPTLIAMICLWTIPSL